MDTFLALIHAARRDLTAAAAPVDPDGLTARQALLLAERAAALASSTPPAQSIAWDLFAAAIGDAIADLQAELPDPAILPADLQPDPADAAASRTAAAALTRQLADLYAVAAAADSGSAWRRLVWAKVAHRLDEADAELR